ncbi:MAG: GTP-binding protein [Clostridiales bacterium]|nr:GTP-binding protein [Clostridiales bacterium]
MTTIDIISGFLGAGKTTLIKKLINEAYQGQKLVLIENEFGEIGIDGGFLQDAGIQITEMNAGCICCSLVGDFSTALREVLDQYHPGRILIEPSGVGKLSDVSTAVGRVAEETGMVLGSAVTVVNAKRCKTYMKNFGEFFIDQVAHAGTIILSRTQDMTEEKLAEVTALLREKNPEATIITTPWDELTGEQMLSAIAGGNSLADELMRQLHAADNGEDEDEDECCHHHHDHDDDEDECCHHHHDHDDNEDEHEHHHHHDDDDDDEHEYHHHHHHDDGDTCSCGHHHHHHHGHDADEVFTSWGTESPRKFTEEEIRAALEALDTGKYGAVLRAKGIVPATDGGWIHYDFVPGEIDIRRGGADYTGRLCVIGSELKEDDLKALFQL